MVHKGPIKIWDFDVDNTVFSKLIKTKNNSTYLVIRPLVLILPKMTRYVKTFEEKRIKLCLCV